jgi:ankyrin repeat protein
MGRLHEAAKNGNLAELIRQLNEGADVNSRESHDVTPLLTAVCNNHPSVVSCLLERGAEVDARDDIEGTPLMAAAAYRHLDVLELLLGKGANVNAKNSEGRSALSFALESKGQSGMGMKVDEAKTLWESGNNANVRVIKSLVNHGADINTRDNTGKTPLMSAARFMDLYCEMDRIGMLKYLVKNGAEVDVSDDQGNSVLMHHIAYNFGETVPTLLEMGATVNTANRDGESPLHLAVKREDDRTIERLLASGAQVTIKDSAGKTPLDVALAMMAEIDYRIDCERYERARKRVDLLQANGVNAPGQEADSRAQNHASPAGRTTA